MLLIFLVLMIPLLFGIAWKSGRLRELFTTVETGNIKFIDAGETNVKTYINIPGKVLRGGVIVDGNSEKEKSWLQKQYGLYWVGFSFLNRKVHTFPLVKERENPNITPETKPEKWIERDDPVEIDELRWQFPRPVLVPAVEFKDKIQGNLLVLVNFEVLVPNTPIYILKARFFEILASYVRIAVIGYCQTKTFNEFVTEVDKKDGGDMSRAILDEVKAGIEGLRKKSEEKVGITVTGLGVSQYDSTKPEAQQALEAAELATIQGLATIKKAEADAKALIVKAEAEAKRKVIDAKGLAKADRILGKASVADVIALNDNFIDTGAHPDVAAQSATSLGRAHRFSKEDSPVSTLVEGQANMAIPPTEKKVVLASK